MTEATESVPVVSAEPLVGTPVDLDLARKRILAGEELTLEEHKLLTAAWRARRTEAFESKAGTMAGAKAKAPPKPKMTLDDLMSDFGGGG